MALKRLDLDHLHNEEHFQFFTEFQTLVGRYDAQKLNISASYAEFVNAYAQENSVLLQIRKSATTYNISELDNDREEMFRGIVFGVKSAQYHFNDTVRTAANRLAIIMAQYGNIERKSYNDESAAIGKLIQEARGTYAADFAATGLTEWINNLELKNKAFLDLLNKRYTEETTKTESNMKIARAATNACFYTIADRIDALALINGAKAYQPFIDELNVRTEKYSNIVAQRKGKRKAAAEKAEAAKTEAPTKPE